MDREGRVGTLAIWTTRRYGVAVRVKRTSARGTDDLKRPIILLGMAEFVSFETTSREGVIGVNRMHCKAKHDLGWRKKTQRT